MVLQSPPEARALSEAVPNLGDAVPCMLRPDLVPAQDVAGSALGGRAVGAALVRDGVEDLRGGHVVDVTEHVLELLQVLDEAADLAGLVEGAEELHDVAEALEGLAHLVA